QTHFGPRRSVPACSAALPPMRATGSSISPPPCRSARLRRSIFAGAEDLMLIAVDADALGDALKWELSRDGDLFPHLYGELPLAAVLWARPLPLGIDQRHVFPELTP